MNRPFQDAGDSTEITLVQSGFAPEARRVLHDGGWSDSFDRLQDVLSRRRDQE